MTSFLTLRKKNVDPNIKFDFFPSNYLLTVQLYRQDRGAEAFISGR